MLCLDSKALCEHLIDRKYASVGTNIRPCGPYWVFRAVDWDLINSGKGLFNPCMKNALVELPARQYLW